MSQIDLSAGILAVKRVDGVPTVFPADSGEVTPDEDMLQVGADPAAAFALALVQSAAWSSDLLTGLSLCLVSHSNHCSPTSAADLEAAVAVFV